MCESFDYKRDDTSFFPVTECAELQARMAFPTGWDRINIDRNDHMSHVANDMDGGVFDGGVLHQVKLPEIRSLTLKPITFARCVDSTKKFLLVNAQ